VGSIHFYNSGWKADFVLITLIVICFAPWLGHVFESIGKDGLKWRVRRGEVPESSGTFLQVKSSGMIEQIPVSGPEGGKGDAVSATVDGTRKPGDTDFHQSLSPNTRAAVIDALLPGFDDFPREAKKVLATLWNFQRAYFPARVGGRWTFLVNPGAKDGDPFGHGATILLRYGLAGYAGNGQLALTDAGIEYCKRHDAKISLWPDIYTTFDN
jgi:hypothetical protein